MRFNWTGLLVAPLLAPVMFSAVMATLMSGGHPLLGFLILMIPGCIVSYGTMVFLFLPSLFLLSSKRPLTGFNVCLVGLLLGAFVFLPLTLLEWKSSGVDSGPPTENFFVFLLRWGADPFTAIYPLAGLMTAALYWWLGKWRGWAVPA